MLIPLEKGGRCLHQNEKEGRKSPWGWIGGFGALIVSGLKYIPALLKMGKFGGTFISMAVTVGAYALLYPWSFAIGLVLMIFIHEMGHIWAAKRKGLPVSAPAFIPFLGALIMLKRQPQDAVTEAYVAFGGPLIGTAGAFMTWLLAGWTGYEVLYPIAFIGFFLNLFNLLPMHPLDGGRIVTAISRWLWVVGLILGLVLIIVLWSPILLFIWILFAFQLWQSFFSKKGQSDEQKVRVVADVNPDLFEEANIPVPGHEHRRDLPFVSYCTLEDREHHCDVYYPSVGVIHQLKGWKGGFLNVRLTGTHRVEKEGENKLQMALEADYIRAAEEQMLRKDQEYYNVSPRTRLGFGLAYLGLVVFLGYMLFALGPYSLMSPHVVS